MALLAHSKLGGPQRENGQVFDYQVLINNQTKNFLAYMLE
jgi:hypothetical protein